MGATIAFEPLVLGPITGASMNPAPLARPAVVGTDWTDLWLYLVGPVAGALLGAAVYGGVLPAGAPADAQLPVIVETAEEGA